MNEYLEEYHMCIYIYMYICMYSLVYLHIYHCFRHVYIHTYIHIPFHEWIPRGISHICMYIIYIYIWLHYYTCIYTTVYVMYTLITLHYIRLHMVGNLPILAAHLFCWYHPQKIMVDIWPGTRMTQSFGGRVGGFNLDILGFWSSQKLIMCKNDWKLQICSGSYAYLFIYIYIYMYIYILGIHGNVLKHKDTYGW